MLMLLLTLLNTETTIVHHLTQGTSIMGVTDVERFLNL